MKIKVFKCGLCKPENRGGMTRRGFRKHLETEHKIMSEKFNSSGVEKAKPHEVAKYKKSWVIEEED